MSKDICQRLSWVLYDTKLIFPRSDVQVPFFQQLYGAGDEGATNMDLAGCLPVPVTFEVERFELRVLYPGPVKNIISRFPLARVSFYVANKTYGEWPLHELVRPRREMTTTKTLFGDKIVEKRRIVGVSLEQHLLLESQINFGMYVDFGKASSMYALQFFLCAMLHGIKTRPVQ